MNNFIVMVIAGMDSCSNDATWQGVVHLIHRHHHWIIPPDNDGLGWMDYEETMEQVEPVEPILVRPFSD